MRIDQKQLLKIGTLKRQTPEDKIESFLLKNRGKQFGGNIISRTLFNSQGGGYSIYLMNLVREKRINKADCPCGKGFVYWVK